MGEKNAFEPHAYDSSKVYRFQYSYPLPLGGKKSKTFDVRMAFEALYTNN